jgi:hypothetical protein
MNLFTSHTRPNGPADEPPVLVREGFSWGACIFGALWLVAWRAWLPALLTFAVAVLVGALGRAVESAAPLLGLALLQGLLCPDLLRWSLARRGYVAGPVVAGPGREAALLRLLDAGAAPGLRPG